MLRELKPRWYNAKDVLSIKEVINKKNSKKKIDGRSEGFSSFNARSEEMTSKPTYKQSWNEGKRCIFPFVVGFKERPNYKEIPSEFEKKQYEIEVSETVCFGGIYDTWKSKNGEELNSCTLITLSGINHPVMSSIYHSRMPLILSMDQAAEWLSEKTTPKQAYPSLK